MSSKSAALLQVTGMAAPHPSLAAMRVHSWLERAVRRHFDRPAVNGMTYARLGWAADRGARRLHELGARAGDRIAIALPGGEDFAVALHGAWKLGCAVVPLDLRAPDPPLAGAEIVVDAPLE